MPFRACSARNDPLPWTVHDLHPGFRQPFQVMRWSSGSNSVNSVQIPLHHLESMIYAVRSRPHLFLTSGSVNLLMFKSIRCRYPFLLHPSARSGCFPEQVPDGRLAESSVPVLLQAAVVAAAPVLQDDPLRRRRTAYGDFPLLRVLAASSEGGDNEEAYNSYNVKFSINQLTIGSPHRYLVLLSPELSLFSPSLPKEPLICVSASIFFRFI